MERILFTSTGAHENIELLLRNGHFCESAQYLRSSSRFVQRIVRRSKNFGETKSPGYLYKTEIPTAEIQANEQQQGNLLQKYEQRFQQLSEDLKLSRQCSEAGLRLVEIGQYLFSLATPRGEEEQSLCREYTMPRDEEGTRGFVVVKDSALSWT